MARYIAKRFLQTLLVIVLVSFITFLLLNLMPKDQVYALYGSEISQEEYESYYKVLQLDKPILFRYFTWAGKAIQGDFGISYAYHMPVSKIIGQKVGVTLYLSIVSTLISFPIGILMGITTAVRRGKWQDTVLTLTANIAQSIPQFVVGIVLLWIFSIKLRLISPRGFVFPWEDFAKHFRLAILPVICLSLSGISGVTRQTRSAMLEAIRQDYVRTARSKGLNEKVIIRKHVLRNGLVPIITLIGHRLATMIGGSMFVENIFAIPGMGTLLIDSVNKVDIPVLLACVMLSAACISVAYLITDILYVLVDPRIRIM